MVEPVKDKKSEEFKEMKQLINSLLVHHNAEPFSIEENQNVEKLVDMVHPYHVERHLG